VSLFSKTAILSLEQLSRQFPQLSRKLDLRKYFTVINPHLYSVEERIQAQAKEFDPGLSGYVEYAIASHGKRIRPALALLSGEATGKINTGHLDLAVVVELIHLASLVHDDIMDGASLRRGQPTTHAKWGPEISVLLGDCLFAHALKLCTNFPTTEVSRKIAEAANEVCSGEILQTQRRYDLKLSVQDYFKIIEMKTGALFRVSTELGAYLNNCSPETVLALRNYGDKLGIAYQVYDDCLDLVGTEDSAGKTLGTDLARGKLTLPVLYVLQQTGGVEHQTMSEIILHGSGEDRLGLLSVMVERGGLKMAVRKLQKYLEEASAALDVLPASEYRSALQAIPLALSEHVEGIAK
jgi:octaprenyl-diphosphate synthase